MAVWGGIGATTETMLADDRLRQERERVLSTPRQDSPITEGGVESGAVVVNSKLEKEKISAK